MINGSRYITGDQTRRALSLGSRACLAGEGEGRKAGVTAASLTLCTSPQYSRQEQEEEGRKRYEAQKLERMETKWRNGDIVQPVLNPGKSWGAGWGAHLPQQVPNVAGS